MSGSISAPTGFFSGNVASAVIAEDLQSAIVNAESLVTTAASLAGQIITPTVNPITGSPTVTSIAGTDYVGISQATADAKITLANLLDGDRSGSRSDHRERHGYLLGRPRLERDGSPDPVGRVAVGSDQAG